MTNEELRALEELRNAHRQMERKRIKVRRRRLLQSLAALILVILVVAPGASALYVSQLSLLQPRGLDSVTNAALFDAFYPVGAIYQTTENINPAAVFGGTWARVEAGRTLVGVGTGFAAGSKGGVQDTTAAYAAFTGGTASGITGAVSLAGSVTAGANASVAGTATGITGAFTLSFTHTLTAAQMPAHTHNIPAHTHDITHSHPCDGPANTSGWPKGSKDTSSADGDRYSYWTGTANPATSSTSGTTGSTGGNTGSTGSGTSFTFTNTGTAANLSGAAAATIPAAGWTGTAAASGNVSGLAGTTSIPAGSVADKTMQPYIVVYIWERTG
jgi:hypothetical protein